MKDGLRGANNAFGFVKRLFAYTKFAFKAIVIAQKLKNIDFEVPDFHLGMWENFFKPERLQLTVAPMGFSKSTILKLFGLYEFLNQTDRFILYASSSHDKTIGQFISIKSVLQSKVIKIQNY